MRARGSSPADIDARGRGDVVAARPGAASLSGARSPRVLVTILRISQGGADRVAMMVCRALAEAGMDVRLAVLRDGGEGEDALLPLLGAGVGVRRAGRALGSRHLELVRGVDFLRAEAAAWRPDVVLASSNNMGLVTGVALGGGRPDRPRLALKFTNPVVRPRDHGLLREAYRRRLYRSVLGRFDAVLTLSQGERLTLCRLYPGLAHRFQTVPNPYVTNAMLASGPTEDRPRRRIVACGRLMPQKRFDRLLDAFAGMSRLDAELTIVGEGPLRGALERQAAGLGLGSRVRFAGFAGDVVPWLRRAHLLALSSDYEGFPAVVLEALACGVPVVSTDCFDEARALLGRAPGCRLVSRDGTEALSAALDEALGLRQAPCALRRAAEPYRMATSAVAHVAAIAALAAGGLAVATGPEDA